MQILKFSEVQLWISLKSLEGKGINNHFMWVDWLSHPSSQEPSQPVAEQAHPQWPRLWSFCWHHSRVGLKTVHSCRYLQQCLHSWDGNLSVKDVAFWAGISLSMLRDLATHSAICVAFLKEHMEEFIIRKLLSLGTLCLLQKNQINLKYW